MAKSLISAILQKTDKMLSYPGCGTLELSSRKTLWLSSFFGLIHVFILTFAFLFFVPELTILIRYGFACLVILMVTLLLIPILTRFFKPYITIHLLLLILVTFYTILKLGGIATSAGLLVACFAFVLLSIPLQSVRITIFMFVVYSVFVAVTGIIGPHLSIPEQITPTRNSVIWMINTLSMSALSLIFVVDFINQRQKFEQLEANKQKELNEAKTKLFTNITHEFRTPLTIIQGMADLISQKPEQWLSDGTEKIKNNSSILLRLVNQMLDLSKIEAGAMSLHVVQADIIASVAFVTSLFQSIARQKNINLHFSPSVSSFIMDFDHDKLVHIVSNLLSNALKFTPERGEIRVSANTAENNRVFILKIEDNGSGIDPLHLPHIFDRFFHVGNSNSNAGGTGLGLALTKELTELLNGEISVESTPGTRTVFTVQFPVSHNAEKGEEPIPAMNFQTEFAGLNQHLQSKPVQINFPSLNQHLPLLLIVEDSKDVSQYLAAILNQEYRIELAKDGKAGLEKALTQIPDIILSDVMMPEMDGIEMLERVKKDFRTSHIPVVLLTAKADIDSRITGLERGADAYLAKPFNETELHTQLKNLIEQRKKLHERYASFAKFPETSDSAIKTEDVFMLKVREILENNFSNEDFDIKELCRALGVSHAQLYRKFKSISNYTIADYFKLMRLNKAKDLLSGSDLNVTQIAFAVGFKNLSYFSREFALHFGKSPKEFRKQGY